MSDRIYNGRFKEKDSDIENKSWSCQQILQEEIIFGNYWNCLFGDKELHL